MFIAICSNHNLAYVHQTYELENSPHEARIQVHTLIWDITPLFEDLQSHMSQSEET